MDCEDLFTDLCRLSVVCPKVAVGMPAEVDRVLSGNLDQTPESDQLAQLYRSSDDLMVCKYINSVLEYIGKKPVFSLKRDSEDLMVITPALRTSYIDINLYEPEDAVNVAAHIISRVPAHNKEANDLPTIRKRFEDSKEFHTLLVRNKIDKFFEFSSERLRDDEAFFTLAMENLSPLFVNLFSTRLRAEPRLVLPLLEKHPEIFGYLPAFAKNETLFLRALKTVDARLLRNVLSSASEKLFWDNLEVAKYVAERNGALMSLFNPRVWDNLEVMEAAVKNYERAYYTASMRLKRNSDFVLFALDYADISPDIPPEFYEDKEFMYAAVTKAFFPTDKIINGTQFDSEFMLELIKRNPKLIEAAPENLRNDTQFMAEAIGLDINNVAFVGERLRSDQKFQKSIAKLGWSPFWELVKDNAAISAKVLKVALKYAEDDYEPLNVEALMNKLFRNFDTFDDYHSTVRSAFRVSKKLAARIISRIAASDYRDLFDALIAAAPQYASDININFTNEQKIALIRNYGKNLKKYPQYQDDVKIVLMAVSNDGMALEHVSYRLRDAKYVVRTAYRQNPFSLEFASLRQQNKIPK